MKTIVCWMFVILVVGGATPARPDILGPLQYFTGDGRLSCPCFVAGDEAGVVFDVPASSYPIEITAVGIVWQSSFGSGAQSYEGALHVYAGGLPDPGAPVYTRLEPVLMGGQVNEFSLLDSLARGVPVANGSFAVTLQFANDNAGNPFLSSVVHDGNGCQPGRNVVHSATGGWQDAHDLGFTGDFKFYIRYRTVNAVVATPEPAEVAFRNVAEGEQRCATGYLTNAGSDTLVIRGIRGPGVDPFAVDTTLTTHRVPPGGRAAFTVCVRNNHTPAKNGSLVVLSNAYNSPTTYVLKFEPAPVPTGVAPMSYPLEITGVIPNPFNPATAVHFRLPVAGPVDAVIYAPDGKRIRTLARRAFYAAGEQSMDWDGRDDHGGPVASGVYFLRLQTRQGTRSARLVLLK